MDATVNARPPAPRLQFETFTLDLHRAELTRAGVPVALRPKTFALLRHLVANAGRAVSKQELIETVWPDAVVTDDSLTQCVAELRAALDDREQRIIKTLPRVGYRFESVVSRDAPAQVQTPAAVPPPGPPPMTLPAPSPVQRHAGWRAGAALVAVLLLVAAGATFWMRSGPADRIEVELPARQSIAVLRFADLSEPQAPHVVHSIHHDLITELGRFREIMVIAAESTAVLGTEDPRRIGRELNVRHVLAGGVQRIGERLSISVRLVRTDTGQVLWTDGFDYPSLADWPGRRDVSARVANALELKVHTSMLQRGVRQPPSREAVDQWMRGRHLMSTFTTHAELLRARVHFEAALAAQPDSAHALAGIAFTHVCEVLLHWSKDRKATLDTAKGLARRALAIDPNDDGALKALTGAHMFGGEADDALSTTRRQLELNPSDAHSNRDLAATYLMQGRWEDVLVHIEVARRLSPLDPSHLWKCHGIRASALIALRRYDEAIEFARLAAAANGSLLGPHLQLAAAQALRGDFAAAREHAAEVLRRSPDYTIARSVKNRRSSVPAYVAGMDHQDEGLRLAGLPE